MDPANPVERLELMLQDLRPHCILTTKEFTTTLPMGSRQVVLDEPDTATRIANCSGTDPVGDFVPQNAAYVIFTSGSTGTPKGVLATHSALTNTLWCVANEFAISSDDTMCAVSSFAFDISLLEIVSPWLMGGAVRIIRHTDVLDVGTVFEKAPQPTALHAVPKLMRQLIDVVHHHPELKTRLRNILTGGDIVPFGLLRDIQTMFASAEIRVLYGPTEAAIICAYEDITSPSGQMNSPIGRPIWNMQLYVLDGNLELVPPGVPGNCILREQG